MHIVDTSGWLEFFADTPNARHFSAAIEDTAALIVPAVVVYEVFKKIRGTLDESRALMAVAHLRQGRVVVLDEPLALLAARLSQDLRLPMADAMIYATAEAHDAVVLTHDEHFKGLPRARYFAKD